MIFRRPTPHPKGPGQESVWEYPRPPRLERAQRSVRVVLASRDIVRAPWGWRVLETSHPPTWYVDPHYIDPSVVRVSKREGSWCEWKGKATYYDLLAGDRWVEGAAWSYEDPSEPFLPMRSCVAFYAAKMDACYVDQEAVRPQPGGFYGGWVTSDVVGPFKGIPGSFGW